jgi:hypothetical protein
MCLLRRGEVHPYLIVVPREILRTVIPLSTIRRRTCPVYRRPLRILGPSIIIMNIPSQIRPSLRVAPQVDRCHMPYDLRPRPPTMSPPTLRPSPPMSPVPPSAPAMSPSQTESVVGSIRRTSLSSITERTSPSSTVPLPPSVRPHARERTVSINILNRDIFPRPLASILNPPTVPKSPFSVSTQPHDRNQSHSYGSRCRRTG